jgi:glycosyltransferase involved in cell wall biosynthesis
VTNKNIFAIPTGVEEYQFSSPDRNKIRKEYNIRDDEVLLVLLTRLTAEKNVEFLIDAIMGVLEKNQKIKFMICGDGDLKSMLIKKVSENNLSDKVIFVGIVPNDTKKNYYAAGDIFVYASKSETQGMILTEAMYSGLPIVAVRATGVRDIVEHGPLRQSSSEASKTGFLVSEDKAEFQTAVQKLIDNENLRKNFREEAKRVAREKYTSSVCAKKMLEVYEKLSFKRSER